MLPIESSDDDYSLVLAQRGRAPGGWLETRSKKRAMSFLERLALEKHVYHGRLDPFFLGLENDPRREMITDLAGEGKPLQVFDLDLAPARGARARIIKGAWWKDKDHTWIESMNESLARSVFQRDHSDRAWHEPASVVHGGEEALTRSTNLGLPDKTGAPENENSLRTEGLNNTGYAAPPLLVGDGHVFPARSTSILKWKVIALGSKGIPWIKGILNLRISAWNGKLFRYFSVYVDGNQVKKGTVYPGKQNDFEIEVIIFKRTDETLVVFDLEIRMYNLQYWDHGWLLTSFWFDNNNFEVLGEYFASSTELEWLVRAGLDTRLDLTIERHWNTPSTLEALVYWDGELKATRDLKVKVNRNVIKLGNWGTSGLHLLKVHVPRAGAWPGKYLVQLARVTRDAVHVEVDFVKDPDGNWTLDGETFRYVELYYRNHGYERVTFHPNETIYWSKTIIYRNNLTNVFIPNHFQNRLYSTWKYCLVGNKLDVDFLGVTSASYVWMFIAMGKIKAIWWLYEANLEKLVLLHETGHLNKIIDMKGNEEIYCENAACAMAKAFIFNCVYEPWYCSHHWYEREIVIPGG